MVEAAADVAVGAEAELELLLHADADGVGRAELGGDVAGPLAGVPAVVREGERPGLRPLRQQVQGLIVRQLPHLPVELRHAAVAGPRICIKPTIPLAPPPPTATPRMLNQVGEEKLTERLLRSCPTATASPNHGPKRC